MHPDSAKTAKARRASRPKVKTGCNNCKNRRVKCDETRPQCQKCVKAGRQCDGYPAYRRVVDVPIPIAPKDSSAPSSLAPSGTNPISTAKSLTPRITKSTVVKRTPRVLNKSRLTPPPTPKLSLSPTLYRPDGLAFDWQEGQYFRVFQKYTASELSGFFDSEFWTRSVLQESHSEASIRHAVVALGALYKTLETAFESPPGSPEGPEGQHHADTAPNHYSFALQQYGKSLARLRESLQDNENRSQRTMLISIVLFTCFQSFTGDHKAAIFQIQSGLGLLEKRRQKSRQPLIRWKYDAVEDELVQMFTRLAIQAKSYDMAFHFPPPYVIQLTPKNNNNDNPGSPQSPSSPSAASTTSLEDPHIPERFTSSKEARASLDSVIERMMRFNEALSAFYAGPNNILPASIKSSGLAFGAQLQQWATAFEPLLQNRRTPGISNTERAGIDVLKMLQIMTTILFRMGYSTSEKEFDTFLASFKEIVELANEVVLDEELSLAQSRCGDASTCRHKHKVSNMGLGMQFRGIASHGLSRPEDSYLHIKASFALDLGIVPPLFVVATKCRDRKLRREAIRLLMSSPRREGMWDSILCGKVATWIMEVEEEGMPPFDRWDPRSFAQMVGDGRRVMIKEITFDLQLREATLRCGTRGARDEDDDPRAKETCMFW